MIGVASDKVHVGSRSMKAPPDLSISVINSGNYGQAAKCLDSVMASGRDLKLEIFVVDNAFSSEGTEDLQGRFPGLTFIRNKRMLGFSTNNNKVLALARGRYVMLLNDDTLVQEDALQNMVDFMDDSPNVGAVGALLLNTDGTAQESFGFSPNPLYDAFRPLSTWLSPSRAAKGQPLEVCSVNGACMLVRSEVVKKVGGLDVAFDPLYSEEIDWCLRISNEGWRIVHLPNARVVHFGSQTMNRVPLTRISTLHLNKARLFRKHFGRRAELVFRAGLFVSSLMKLLVWILVFPFRPSEATTRLQRHSHVMRIALSSCRAN